jgi:predicted metal-dependent phosphoesterase TrpH
MFGYFQGIPHAKKWGMELVPGVEVTTSLYHILGLHVDPTNQTFQDFLKHSRELQELRCAAKCEVLQSQGWPISIEKVREAFPNARRGTYNILMAMYQDEACRDFIARALPGISPQEIMDDRIDVIRIGKKKAVRSKETIEQIHAAGGIAIVAHPFKQTNDLENIARLVKKGLDGVEVQPNYGDRNIPFERYARKNGLIITLGSDYHGPPVDRKLLGTRGRLETCLTST